MNEIICSFLVIFVRLLVFIWLVVLSCMFGVVIIVGNVVVFIVIYCMKVLYIIFNFFIVLLVVVDMVVGIFFNFVLFVKVVIFSYLNFDFLIRGFVFDKVEDFVWI